MMIGHSVDDVYAAAARLGNTRLGDIPGNLIGRGGIHPFQRAMGKDVRNLVNMIPGVSSKAAVHAGRFAGRAVPLLSLLTNVTDVADIVAGDESFGNKAMDASAMAAGAAIGGVLGGGVFSPLTASIGASTGKLLSDGTQWLFGDKKTPEQRKMEEALAGLQQGIY
jgi:hypothetical protein